MKLKNSEWIQWILSAAILIIVALKIVMTADRLGYHADELLDNTYAAVKLFTQGDYSAPRFPAPFDVQVSSGIWVTWPSALVWLSHHGSLLAQRLWVSGWVLIQCLVLCLAFARAKGLRWSSSFLLSASVLLALTRLPYWHGFIQNLGELPGAVCLLFAGLLLSQGKPRWAFLVAGIAIWYCKFIYILAAAAVGIGYWISRRNSWRETLLWGLLFFSPALAWMALIAVLQGPGLAVSYLPKLFWFASHERSVGTTAKASLTLAERLKTLEWAQYSHATQFKFLLLLWGPALLIRRRSSAVAISLAVALLIYSAWWFLLHTTMVARHIQPALYLGFGFWVAWLVSKKWPNLHHHKVWFLGALALWAIGEVTSLWVQRPVFLSEVSYARACSQEFKSSTCIPDFPLDKSQ